jgi:hypothetical protein
LVIVASGLISRPLLAIPENDGGSGNHCIRLPFFDAVEGQISFWGLLLDNYEFRYVFPEEFRVMLTDIHHSAILPFRHFHSHSILRFRPSTPRFIAVCSGGAELISLNLLRLLCGGGDQLQADVVQDQKRSNRQKGRMRSAFHFVST